MSEIEPIGILPIYDDGPLDYPDSYCCDFLKSQFTHCRGPAGHVTNTAQCPDQIICYSARVREFTLSPLGAPHYSIGFCPGCGHQFPANLRNEWFDALEQQGIEPFMAGTIIPDDYQTDKWWRDRGL